MEARGRPDARTGNGPRPFAVAMSIGALLVVATGWFGVLAPPPTPVTFVATLGGGYNVADVQVGSEPWLFGVRPGSRVVVTIPLEDAHDDPTRDPWLAVAVRLQGGATVPINSVTTPLPVSTLLVAIAALGLAALVAWFAGEFAWFILIAMAASLMPVLVGRLPGPLGAAAFLAPAALAALYALDGRRPSSPLTRSAAAAVVVALAAAWLTLARPAEDNWALLLGLDYLGTIAIVQAGLAHSAREFMERVRSHLTEELDLGTPGPAALRRVVLDELVGGRAASRRSAAEAERARLAGEIHAELLPNLAEILRELELEKPDSAAARRLREVTEGLRDITSERRLAVLDELGLVAGLEWLAERAEDRAPPVRVELDVIDDATTLQDRPPRPVELAAFRIARLAVDNAIQHARAALVTLRIETTPDRVMLEIADDGPGLDVSAVATALRAGHQGIPDMRFAADAVSGRLRIEAAAGGGTVVGFDWRRGGLDR